MSRGWGADFSIVTSSVAACALVPGALLWHYQRASQPAASRPL